jgi:hypothetical protein
MSAPLDAIARELVSLVDTGVPTEVGRLPA